MQIKYVGLRKPGHRFKVVIQETGTALMVDPGESIQLPAEEGRALIAQYPDCFEGSRQRKAVEEIVFEDTPEVEENGASENSDPA